MDLPIERQNDLEQIRRTRKLLLDTYRDEQIRAIERTHFIMKIRLALCVAGMIGVILMFIFLKPKEAHAESAVIAIARAELGRGETIGDNDGPDVLRYTRGKRAAWCAGFVSYVLDQAGSNPFGDTLSARSMLNRARTLGLATKTPAPGCVVIWSRGEGKGHAGIVIEAHKDGGFRSIEGNVGEFPAKVKIINHKPGEKNLLAFLEVN
jgi:uncharacterized protein (TIGR02594 family)